MKTATPAEALPAKNTTPKKERGKRESKRSPILHGLAIFGIVCLLLIPTYIAVFDYVIHRDSPASKRTAVYSLAVLNGPTGQTFTASPAEDGKEAGLLEILGALVAGGERISTIPSDFRNIYQLTMSGDTGTESYRLYCNALSPSLYYADSNGNCFRAAAADAGAFLNGNYAFELYGQSTTPILTTAATDEIIPSEIEWFYRTQDGTFSRRDAVETTQELHTYPIANDIGFTFSVPPDHYTITVTQNGSSTTYYDQGTFTTPQLAENERLDVTITALYDQNTGVEYYGTATYRFQMNLVEAAQFTPNRTAITEGGYLILSCKNVQNPQKLQISSDPALTGDPVIFRRGETVYAAIPVGEAGAKTLSMTYGTISDSFVLTITPNTSAGNIENPDWDEAFFSTLYAWIAEKGSGAASDAVTPSGLFADPAAAGAVRVASFGDELRLSDGSVCTLPFELYREARSVNALSFGIVIEAGTHPILGGYIILDHGCGLYTWYCGLSELRTARDAVVAVGEELGVAGNLNGESSYLVFTTIGKTAVSPAELRSSPYLS